jgi:chromosome segregation ATPase
MTGNKIPWILILIALWILPSLSWADKKPDTKKVCKEAKAQVEAIEKELVDIKEKKTQLEEEVEPVKTEFFAEQEKLRGMSHCSEGNPNNPPDCQTQLAKVRKLGDKLTQLQNSMNPLTPRRIELENSIYKPKNDLILNKCEKK